MFRYLVLLSLAMTAGPVIAGPALVENVEITAEGDDRYRFAVTVRHADTGWDHYANAWEVLSPEGKVLGTRTLHHPHVNEQPFTRGLGGVKIPADITEVHVRANDSVHGVGPVYRVPVPAR